MKLQKSFFLKKKLTFHTNLLECGSIPLINDREEVELELMISYVDMSGKVLTLLVHQGKQPNYHRKMQ